MLFELDNEHLPSGASTPVGVASLRAHTPGARRVFAGAGLVLPERGGGVAGPKALGGPGWRCTQHTHHVQSERDGIGRLLDRVDHLFIIPPPNSYPHIANKKSFPCGAPMQHLAPRRNLECLNGHLSTLDWDFYFIFCYVCHTNMARVETHHVQSARL